MALFEPARHEPLIDTPWEEGAARKVFEHSQRLVENVRPIGRHAQRVLRVVEAGDGVRVRADAEADRRQEVVDGLAREMP